MDYSEFEQRWAEESDKQRASYDRRPVSSLLDDVRAGRLGEQYQLWHSIGARASLAEAGPLLLDFLDSNAEYLQRYHCAAAFIKIAKLEKSYEPVHLSVHALHPVRETIATLRQQCRLGPESLEKRVGASPIEADKSRQAMSSANLGSPAIPPAQSRSGAVSAFAWVVIGLSVLCLPISLISTLMFIAGSYGTQNADPLGAITVILGPAVTLVAGFGIWRRRNWARSLMIAILTIAAISNVASMIRAATGPKHYISAAGVPTTVISGGESWLQMMILICVVLIAFLCSKKVRSEFSGPHILRLFGSRA